MLVLPLYDDNPNTSMPFVTYTLIVACVFVFVWQTELSPQQAHRVVLEYGMIPAVLFGYVEPAPQLHAVPAWMTLFTSMFLHGGWLHLCGNMIYLLLFGKGVESALGPARFLVLYLICGVAAGLAQAVIDPASELPMIGASGAIAGTLGAYLVLHPRGNIVVFLWFFVFVRFITVPAVIVLGLWFLLQLMSALSAAPGDPGVAFWAHIGGFVVGMLLVPVFRRPGTPLLQPARSDAFSVSRRGIPRRGPWG
jgi:membrane associated rhomboid family serine protease